MPQDHISYILYRTQSVERYIKLVTKASPVVIGPQERDGFVTTSVPSLEEKKKNVVDSTGVPTSHAFTKIGKKEKKLDREQRWEAAS